MANILLSTIVKDAASRTSGMKLKELLLEMINKENEITVDFTGMNRYASPFFNNSFASLYIALDPNNREKIIPINLSEVGQLIYNTSMNNAKFLLNNPEYKDEIASIVSQTPKVV
jgi:hypothetical protein|nr:MAG TPA: protein of unknown function DUF4325 [Bacteriophage sp.]